MEHLWLLLKSGRIVKYKYSDSMTRISSAGLSGSQISVCPVDSGDSSQHICKITPTKQCTVFGSWQLLVQIERGRIYIQYLTV